MRTRVLRFTVASMFLALLSVFAAAEVPRILDNRPDCRKATEWVQAHAQDLPRTLAEISA